MEELEGRLLLSTFTVNSANDVDDGVCDAVHCSLREALRAANATQDPDRISFAEPSPGVPTIRPATPLSEITSPVVLDGTTQPGGLVEIDGSLIQPPADRPCFDGFVEKCGLVISGGRSTVRGLVINRFPGVGLVFHGAGDNLLEGNLIGTDPSGTNGLANLRGGVVVLNSPNNTIGGVGTGARNVISGNQGTGVYVSGPGATGNVLMGNFIGADASGTRMLRERQISGVFFSQASGNTIGGATPGAGNVISGNGTGIGIQLATPGGNLIQGNFIGTDASGTLALGNLSSGIVLAATNGNTIGGTSAGAGNVIAFNGGDGVVVLAGSNYGNTILANSIFENVELGIDWVNEGWGDGVTINDHLNADGVTNYPILTAVQLGASPVIDGFLDSTPNTMFRIEFFSNRTLDPSGNGEGETLVGATSVVTGANGLAQFSVHLPVPVATGKFVTATATDPEGNTSEFSSVIAQDVVGPVVTVNTSDDDADGVCDAVHCSLRDAIIVANANPVVQQIHFSIPVAGVPTIRPAHLLPSIRNPVVIDGTKQPAGKVELDGSLAEGGFFGSSGLVISAGSSVVRGMVINRFRNAGIILQSKGGNRIEGNLLGTDETGTVALGNSGGGVKIESTSRNTIGGTTPDARNVIAGGNPSSSPGYFAVQVIGPGATENLIQGNYIGTDITGTRALGYQIGVAVEGASRNTIGGTTSGTGNVIAGNSYADVYLFNGSNENLVQGNLIGSDSSRTARISNGIHSVFIDEASDNTIGGRALGAGNLIAGPDVTITGERSQRNVVIDNRTLPDVPPLVVNTTDDSDDGSCDAMHCSLREAINAANTNPRIDTINFGVPGDGVPTIRPSRELPEITDSVTIDGTTQNEGKVELDGSLAASSPSRLCHLIPFEACGLVISAGESTVRGLVINRFGDAQIYLKGTGRNTIQGNFIGTDVTGSTSFAGQSRFGILIESRDNTIGGTLAHGAEMCQGNCNLISGHMEGIRIRAVDASGEHNTVRGNFIGTDSTGRFSLANGNGIFVAGTGNTIGGHDSGEGNLISGNIEGVVVFGGSGGQGRNLIQGNRIGTDISGFAPLGNSSRGILVWMSANNTTGGTEPHAGNSIAFNGQQGVLVLSGTSTGNAILANSIFSNGGLGIDLASDGTSDQVTSNDLADQDTVPNELQNFPVLTEAQSTAPSSRIRGSLNGVPNTAYRLEFFSNRSADPSGFGEGEQFLGATSVTTDGSGDAQFDVTLSAPVPLGYSVTATATDPDGNTSEFSAAIQVTQSPGSPSTGAVRVRLAGGRLVIQGSTANDNVRIEAAGPNAFRLSPGTGTLINGQAEPVVFTGVTRGMHVRLGYGNDSILLDGSVNLLPIGGGLSIDAGSGDDTVRLDGVAIRGRTNLDAGPGNDLVAITDSILSRELNLISGAGADRIVLAHSHFIRQVVIEAARRQDVLDLDDSMFDLRPLITENVARFLRWGGSTRKI